MTSTVKADEHGQLEVVVHSMTRSCERSVMLEFRPLEAGAQLPEFFAGSHIDVHIPGPSASAPALVRQYSLVNSDATSDRCTIAVLKEPSSTGGSIGIHERVRVGDVLKISEPRNHFPLAASEGGRSLLLAGGIGVTPIAAMAEHLHRTGVQFEFHHYAAAPQLTPLREYLVGRPFEVQFHSAADGDGFSEVSSLPLSYREGDHLYVCGPAGFISHARDIALAEGWPESAVHWEKFKPDEPVELTGDSFEVIAKSDGRVMKVNEEQTIAQVLEENGYAVELSCEMGICGSCITGVLEGIPDHRDEVQTDAEHAANNQINVCCSRSRTPSLTLDV